MQHSYSRTQINPYLLFNNKAVRNNLFRDENHVDVMANNYNELIGRRKKGGVLLSIRNYLSKCSSAAGKDATGLGRGVYSDIITPQKKD